jgi:DNA-directed RNA polymerase beta' subunit
MSVNPAYYSEDVKKISFVEFSVFRNKDVKLYSAVNGDPFGIDLAESYENYEPKKGGLVDLRLGTCDIYLPCTTCGQNSIDCPGHFGHTILASPVFNFGFLNHLKNVLQCVCLKCSNLLVEKSDVHFKKALNKKCESRFKEIKILTKNVNYCFHCGVPVPKIKREVKDNGSIRIMIERDVNNGTGQDNDEVNNIKKIKESLTPRDCYNILRNVSDNDCYLLGFNPKMQRPEDLIIENFPIPPSIIRPTAKVDFMSAATMEDALTLKISDIITANKRVRQQIEKETVSNELSTYNQDIFNLLQYHVATFYDNDSVSLPRTEFKTGGRPTKSISDRIKGKTGRVRSNLMGKRVDFSGRTVITSDPYIDIDQVGIPKKMAMELTIPEEVTPYNIKYLTGLVKNGRDVYPGANFVLRINFRDGKQEIQKIDLKYRKKAIRLNLDDIVERHSVDGDYVLFNRQPTLHKPSMMGHKIQVIDNDELNTFRMNVSVCKPYNADFDGDEMNIHLAQSIQARNELKRIANVQYQIISAKDSSPIIGCQQDTLSGAYMLTDPNVKLIGWEIANILCNTTSDTKFNIKMNKEYSGHEIFSHIIPAGINTTKKSGDKITLQITNGKLISGYLDKSALSFAKNSIIHFIWDKYGPGKTRRFIDDSQRLVLNYLLFRGQTIGLKDTIINEDMSNKIQQVISNKILESKYQITQFENDTDQISLETIEASLSAELSAVQSNIGQILMGQINIDNFFWTSATSGAKGNPSNVAQVSGVLGQNNVDGSRIKKKIEGRSLIYWHRDDDTPEARGFIKSSYLGGLKGFEFFYNAMAGREGLIDTAIKSVTWETPIVIIENNQPVYIEIGKWIDELLLTNPDKIQHLEEQNMELMDLPNGTVYIPTTDYAGNVSWGKISAITRHDPGKELYEIKTNSGRSVIVTASKSLLIWHEATKQFKEMLTSEIKVGDCVPVTGHLCQIPNNVLDNIKLSDNRLLNVICGKNNIEEINNYLDLYSPIIFDNIMEANCYQMLCSRVGIVGNIEKTNTNHYIFNKLDVYNSVNDVILDPIIEIIPIDTKLHPKVYDLTIPSTFNFGLANGLQVRDTAQTGYIQRQLIKGLEDLSIKYDGTNRNARGIIIQTVYGENGINQATQTELQFNILSMDNKTLTEKLGFSPEQIKKLEKVTKLSNKELTDLNKKQCNKLLQLRDELRDIQTRAILNYKVITEKFVTSVNLFRITQDYSNNKEHLELSPIEIYEGIESFLSNYDNRLITSMKSTDKFIKQDDRNLKFLLEVALNEYLAPVKCIFEYGLSRKEFQTMMKEIQMSFTKAIIEPGEMVGIVAAQSVGEPTSQMTLNTKHFAGVAKGGSANMGVSRILELVHFSKNIKTPQMQIYFTEPYATDRSALNKVVSYFKYLSIRHLISSAEVYYDVGTNDVNGKKLKADNVSSPFFINNQKAEISSLPFVFRIKMDIEKMIDKETTLLDIKTKFISYWYKNYTNLKNLKKSEKEVISRISRCAILSNNITNNEQVIHIRFSMSSFNYNIITDFLKMVFDDITLKGIENIEGIDIAQELVIKFDKETGGVKTEKEYLVYTAGINIENMRLMKGIDHVRTKCNDIANILKYYGIEAARQILIHELTSTYSNGGSNINQNHLSLLVDQMCHLGEIISIDRHGLGKIDMDPIAKASFEKTMDHFVNAALFNEKDQMKSVSSRIAVGRVISGGTGVFDLLLDTKKLENSEYTEDETGGRITFTPLEEEPLIQDIMKYNVGKNDFYMPTISNVSK